MSSVHAHLQAAQRATCLENTKSWKIAIHIRQGNTGSWHLPSLIELESLFRFVVLNRMGRDSVICPCQVSLCQSFLLSQHLQFCLFFQRKTINLQIKTTPSLKQQAFLWETRAAQTLPCREKQTSRFLSRLPLPPCGILLLPPALTSLPFPQEVQLFSSLCLRILQ